MNSLENDSFPARKLWRPELLTSEELYASLKDDYWTARTAAYRALGMKTPHLGSLEEEKLLCPDFEKYHALFESCFENEKIVVQCRCLEHGKMVCAAMPVDWLKLIHKGRLTDDGIEDKDVRKAGLYISPELTAAWLLIEGKACLSKRRPAHEREDMVFIWKAARKVRKNFPHLPPRMIAQIVHHHTLKHRKYPFKTVYGWVISSFTPMNEQSTRKRRDRNGRPKKGSYPKITFDFSSYFSDL